MSCKDSVCGTGGWTGPLPGDPDNLSTFITAVGVPGGVEVSWTYPLLNPHAVSHFVLYRGKSSSFVHAVEHCLVGGNVYFDRLDAADLQQYYYWIEIVSINGTRGSRIGPATARPLDAITKIIQELTGRIDAGVLAQSLRTQIDRIDLISGDLAGEAADRVAAGAAFANALAAVQSDTDEVMTFIQNEITARTDSDTAIVTSVNALAAGVAGNAAAILDQKTVSAAADAALASDIELVYARVDNTDAALVTEGSARVDGDNALAQQITTAQTTLNENIASAKTTLQTDIATTNGRVTAIGARYTAVVDVNGLVGGFGVYNDGTSVQAGFNVDTFWVGRTVNKVKPFIIDGGVVYINQAMIADASITSAKIQTAAITRAKIGIAEIDTLRIAGRAITIPVSGSAYATSGAKVLSITLPQVDFEGATVSLVVSAFAQKLNSYVNDVGMIEVTRNGAAILNVPFGSSSFQTTRCFVDTPPSGGVTYAASITISAASTYVGDLHSTAHLGMVAIGLKR